MIGRGVFIVLEGSDGSGKATQLNLLKERLEAVGYDVAVFDFPRYAEPSSHFVKRYLNGEYGPAADVNPYTASLFYALDRYEAARMIKQAVSNGKIVLSNRYVGSNMAHQGSKFSSAAEQRGFFVWADSIEYQLLGIPRPNLNIYLRVPAELSYKLIAKKPTRSYTDKKHDEHEADINHLKRTVETYDLLCQLFPKDFYSIDCANGDQMLSIPAVNDLIWQQLQPFLSNIPKHSPHSKVVNMDSFALPELKSKAKINTTSVDVDSKSQSFRLKIGSVSLLAIRNLARSNNTEIQLKPKRNPSFFQPKLHEQHLLKNYRSVMKEAIARHQLIVRVTKESKNIGTAPPDLLLSVTPLAFEYDIDIQTDFSGVQRLITEATGSELTELSIISHGLYDAAHAKYPKDFNIAPNRASKKGSKDIHDLVGKLPQPLADPDTPAKIIAAVPRNEFELINEEVYKHSSLETSDISSVTDGLSYDQKARLLKQSIEALGPKFYEMGVVSYELEILASGVTLSYMMKNRLLDQVTPQPATPRYGYEVPDWVSDSGIEDLYIECFDDSLDLFSKLQSAGHEHEAQYAVLMGHRLRWRAKMTFGDIFRFKILVEGPNCSDETKALFEAIKSLTSQTHPLINDLLLSAQGPKMVDVPKMNTGPSLRRPRKRTKKDR